MKGLYAKARQGLINDFTGVSSPYEAPDSPERLLDTDQLSVEKCVDMVLTLLRERGITPDVHTNLGE